MSPVEKSLRSIERKLARVELAQLEILDAIADLADSGTDDRIKAVAAKVRKTTHKLKAAVDAADDDEPSTSLD